MTLTFSEGPALFAAATKLPLKPDLIESLQIDPPYSCKQTVGVKLKGSLVHRSRSARVMPLISRLSVWRGK